MSRRRAVPLALALSLVLAGCSTLSDGLDAINPFSSSGPKIPPLKPFTPKADAQLRWTAPVGKAGDAIFAPALVGKAIYAAAQDGTVNKFEDGKLVWKIQAGQALSAGVGANEKWVAVGTPKGEVLVFAAGDGKLLWSARASSEILAAPAVSEDGIAVRSGDNRVFLFDAQTGQRKWVYQRATPALSVRNVAAPVFAERYLFVGFPGGKLVALGLQNGAPVWEGPVALPKGATELDRVADIVTPPAIDGRQVCSVAFQGRVACFDLGQSGALIWSRDISSANGLVLDGRYLFLTDDKGAVHAFDRLSGSSLWKQTELAGRRLSGPAVGRGVVVVADVEGMVHLLSREDGSVVARLKTDGSPVRTPVLSLGSEFVVQTTAGQLSLIEKQ